MLQIILISGQVQQTFSLYKRTIRQLTLLTELHNVSLEIIRYLSCFAIKYGKRDLLFHFCSSQRGDIQDKQVSNFFTMSVCCVCFGQIQSQTHFTEAQ
jgi:hypothetical protein